MENMIPRDLLVVTSQNVEVNRWRKTLSSGGWHVYFASSVEEASDCLRSGIPSACVLDIDANVATELTEILASSSLPVVVLVTDEKLFVQIRNKKGLVLTPLSPLAVLEVLKATVPPA